MLDLDFFQKLQNSFLSDVDYISTVFGPPTKEGKGPTNSLPSVRPFVRSSGAFRKNHSLEFSEILHEGILSLYWLNSIFRFLKKN